MSLYMDQQSRMVSQASPLRIGCGANIQIHMTCTYYCCSVLVRGRDETLTLKCR